MEPVNNSNPSEAWPNGIHRIAAQNRAQNWAMDVLSKNFLIVDTETTGVTDKDEIVEIAIVGPKGPLLQAVVKPTVPIQATAAAVNGFTWDRVENAPSIARLHSYTQELFDQAEVILMYGVDFDMRLINQSLRAQRWIEFREDVTAKCQCVQKMYAQYVGQWNPKYADWKFQKLPKGDHTSLGDCEATYDLLLMMAGLVDRRAKTDWSKYGA